jgi:hypothetical protein
MAESAWEGVGGQPTDQEPPSYGRNQESKDGAFWRALLGTAHGPWYMGQLKGMRTVDEAGSKAESGGAWTVDEGDAVPLHLAL